jgi:hypothetical protein
MAGSDYLCVAIVATSTFRHSSRVAGSTLRRNGFWWTCMFNLHGRTNSCLPLVKTQRAEPSMNARLSGLVKRVSELRAVGLKACHCVEEFHHRRIHPLRCRKRRAYECPRMANPNLKPTDSKLSTSFFKYWGLH